MQQRGAKLQEANQILDLAQSEERDLTTEEREKVDGLNAEIQALDGKIDQAQKDEQLQRRAADASQAGHAGSGGDGLSEKEKRELGSFSFLKVMRAARSQSKLEGLEAEMAQEAANEFRNSGVTTGGSDYLIPSLIINAEQRDMTAGTGTEGGFNVATAVEGYIPSLRERSLALQLGAGNLTGLVGNIDIPAENAVYSATWEGETDEAAEQSPTYTRKQATPKRLAGKIDVSNQLLMQTSPSVEASIRGQIQDGQAEGLDLAAFAGTGSGQPTGVINASGVIAHAFGTNGAAPSLANTLTFEELAAVAKSYGVKSFVTTPRVRRKMKGTAVDGGSGSMLWDLRDNSVMGVPGFVTNHLPDDLDKGSSTGVCSAAILGDFSSTSFYQWGGLEILVDPYTKAGQGLTRMVVNQYADFHVLQAGHFVVAKDILGA